MCCAPTGPTAFFPQFRPAWRLEAWPRPCTTDPSPSSLAAQLLIRASTAVISRISTDRLPQHHPPRQAHYSPTLVPLNQSIDFSFVPAMKLFSKRCINVVGVAPHPFISMLLFDYDPTMGGGAAPIRNGFSAFPAAHILVSCSLQQNAAVSPHQPTNQQVISTISTFFVTG
jgi:hypothetical protein